jgi:hypothetical protein
VTLLALLDVAEEYVQARKRVAGYQREVADKSKELSNLLDAEFK